MDGAKPQLIAQDAQSLFNELEETLSSLGSPGDFSCGEVLPNCPNPLLEVNGFGILPIPIIELTATAIIKLCEQAPFGRGEQTIVDKTVRNTWQLDPGQFQFRNPKFIDFVNNELVGQISKRLGCGAEATIKANIYKLLVYEKDQFFLPHKDSEKEDGMFGTLVLTLPSDYAGGELIISHGGKSVTYSHDAERSLSECQYAAFYADCTHEVRPLTRGYRMALIFNLVSSDSARIHAPSDSGVEKKVTQILKDWKHSASVDPIDASIYAYMLEHEYTKAGLSFGALKNGEAKLGALLTAAAQAAGVKCYLALLKVHQTGHVSNDWEYSHNRSIDPIITMDQSTSKWEILAAVDPQGMQHEKPFNTELLNEKTIGPFQALKYADPSKEKIGAPTGNAGMSVDRWYHKAAIVLDPGASKIALKDADQIIKQIQKLVATGGNPDLRDEAPLESNPYKLSRVLFWNADKFHFGWRELWAVTAALAKCDMATKSIMDWLIKKVQGAIKGVSYYCGTKLDTDCAVRTILLLGEKVGWDAVLPAEFPEPATSEDVEGEYDCEKDDDEDEGEGEENVDGKITNKGWRQDLARLFLLAACRTKDAVAKERLAQLALPTFMSLVDNSIGHRRLLLPTADIAQIFALCIALKKDDELGRFAKHIEAAGSMQDWPRFKNLDSFCDDLERTIAEMKDFNEALKEYAGLSSPAAECPIFDQMLHRLLDKAKENAPEQPVDPNANPGVIKADLNCTCKYCTKVAAFFKTKKKTLKLEVAKSTMSHVRARAKAHVKVTTVSDTELKLAKNPPNASDYDRKQHVYSRRMAALRSLEEMIVGKAEMEPPAKRIKLDNPEPQSSAQVPTTSAPAAAAAVAPAQPAEANPAVDLPLAIKAALSFV